MLDQKGFSCQPVGGGGQPAGGPVGGGSPTRRQRRQVDNLHDSIRPSRLRRGRPKNTFNFAGYVAELRTSCRNQGTWNQGVYWGWKFNWYLPFKQIRIKQNGRKGHKPAIKSIFSFQSPPVQPETNIFFTASFLQMHPWLMHHTVWLRTLWLCCQILLCWKKGKHVQYFNIYMQLLVINLNGKLISLLISKTNEKYCNNFSFWLSFNRAIFLVGHSE